MKTMIHAHAALQPKSALTPFEYTPNALLPNEVEVAVTHCGICHSDVHLVDNDWGVSTYPLVPGHEIIGSVAAMGSEVNQFKIGQRVGIGWQCGSCLKCESCKQGEENLCEHEQPVAIRHFGGFADKVTSHERFVVAIPDEMSSEQAAPLLCAGITVYSPLRNFNVKSHHQVGIIGIGGLGHLALQFANAFGCEVTAFSSDQSKAEEAKSFGAHHFVSSNNELDLNKYARSFDFLLSTTTAELNWEAYLQLLKPHGQLCFVGVTKNLNISVFSLISGNRSICGSAIGSPLLIQEMLQFANRHHIQAKTQLMPMHEATKALNLVRQNKARYRIVLSS